MVFLPKIPDRKYLKNNTFKVLCPLFTTEKYINIKGGEYTKLDKACNIYYNTDCSSKKDRSYVKRKS